MLCAATWLGTGHALLGRIDRTLHDAALVLWRRPPPPDIVIVAADEPSLAALGRWPWRRAVHATLVERLAAAKARAIALDVIFAEPDAADPGGDAALARAVAKAGNVVLASPVVDVPGVGARDVLPIAPLREAAAALAHIQVETDEDGVVRSLFLAEGAPSLRPYLGLAALQVAGLGPAALPVEGRLRIPWYGGDPTVTRYSYLAVLRGDVPDAAFAGRVVFVGTTAAGLGDDHPSPAGGRTAPMAGVEIAAQVAGALREGAAIRDVRASMALVSVALVLAILFLYRVLQPRAALVLTAGAFLAVLAGSLVALRWPGVWLPPTAALAGIALCYPLWSWRRLEASLRFMRGELAAIRAEPGQSVPGTAHRPLPGEMDAVEATIVPLQDAIEDLRNARRFIADTVESLPGALFVTDTSGRVVLANARAQAWVAPDGVPPGHEAPRLAGRPLDRVLLDFRPEGARSWESVIDEALAGRLVAQVEARGPGGRDLLVLFSPCYRASGEPSGLIVNMVDVSERREAERRREELLRVLSHDMRAPQASILTLLEMRDMDAAAVDAGTLLGRVRGFARRTLDLADDFLRLARAEQVRAAQFVPLDLADVATEACDEAWTLARARRIRIVRSFAVEEALVAGDRALLLRMLENLLVNAIKYSGEATTVTVSLEPQGVSWLLRVADQGCGIAREDIPRLFTRFGRVAPGKAGPDGVGLGLVLVKTVVERHRGVVSVASEPGAGSVFSVSLPAYRD